MSKKGQGNKGQEHGISELGTPYLILSLLEANGGQIEGRTRLQKLVYFLGRNGLSNVQFNPHFYGPYSPEVESTVQTLVSFGLVEETSRTPTLVDFDRAVFEPRFFKYELTDKGRQVLVKKVQPNSPELRKITTFLEEIKGKKEGFRTGTLSAAAKIDYILSTLNRTASMLEISSMARKLGWRLGKQEIKTVGKFLIELGLASKG